MNKYATKLLYIYDAEGTCDKMVSARASKRDEQLSTHVLGAGARRLSGMKPRIQ